MTRAENLANAIELMAKANHYMLGIVEPITLDEIGDARQLLINRQNTLLPSQRARFKRLDLALDITELLLDALVDQKEQNDG